MMKNARIESCIIMRQTKKIYLFFFLLLTQANNIERRVRLCLLCFLAHFVCVGHSKKTRKLPPISIICHRPIISSVI